jgi:serine/threonine protein kinase
LKIDPYGQKWKIGDLGLSQPANSSSLNNEIYGVIPYVAPEIFKGVNFSKASDIYSMGMIIWELTTGCKPFSNIEHDSEFIYEIIDGKRPKITNDTPEYFADLMNKCWDSDLLKRPSATKINRTIGLSIDDINIFNQAEELRLELIELKMLGPEFSEKSKSDYTNRSLSSFISEYSVTSFNTKQRMCSFR